MWWASVSREVGRGGIASHSPPLPGLLLYLGDLSGFWFCWGLRRMWGPSIKDSKHRELVADGGLVWVLTEV